VVVGGVGEAADAAQIDSIADVGALEEGLETGPPGDPGPELLAVDTFAVEHPQEHHLLHALLARLAGAEGLSERIFDQLLEKQVLPKFLRDVHLMPPAGCRAVLLA